MVHDHRSSPRSTPPHPEQPPPALPRLLRVSSARPRSALSGHQDARTLAGNPRKRESVPPQAQHSRFLPEFCMAGSSVPQPLKTPPAELDSQRPAGRRRSAPPPGAPEGPELARAAARPPRARQKTRGPAATTPSPASRRLPCPARAPPATALEWVVLRAGAESNSGWCGSGTEFVRINAKRA